MITMMNAIKLAKCLRIPVLACSFLTVGYSATVFSSDFSDSNNVGQVGGGLFSGAASDVQIGTSGPWHGTYNGILGALAAPKLEVKTTGGFTGGSGTIDNLLGLNLLGGLTDNSGWFFADTGLLYLPNTQYTLSANVFIGGIINNVSVLSNAGVGIGLTHAGDNVVAATTDPAALLSLSLLSANFYRLSMTFTTGGTAPSGNIGVRLFDQPQGLAQASLISSVTFSNVQLDASAIPEPSTELLGGCALIALGLWKRRRDSRTK